MVLEIQTHEFYIEGSSAESKNGPNSRYLVQKIWLIRYLFRSLRQTEMRSNSIRNSHEQLHVYRLYLSKVKNKNV